MLRNYILTSLRNLRKHFTYSLINILGLGLGLATFLLLFVWIQHELSYDRFHVNANRIYRGSLEYSFGGQTSKTSVSPTALLPVLQKNFADVENGVRVYNPSAYNPYLVRKDDKLFQESRFYYADSTFFDVFSFHLVSGSIRHALNQPNTVVLTRSAAKKYFGEEDPMGKVLRVNNRYDYTVTGLMENVPSNSLLQFDFLASFTSLDAAREQIWWSANYQTYLLLAPGANIAQLTEKTNQLVKKELAAELTNPQDYVKYNFMALTDIYLRSETDEPEVVGSIYYVYGFGAIAVLIIVIAGINYVNLATAKAADRAREVGIRKVVGAIRGQLIAQFMGESIIITSVSFLLATVIAMLSMPLFNSITGKNFDAFILLSPQFLLASTGAMIGVAVVAGAYPALAITSFKPVSVLKGNFKTSGRGTWLRQSLVVFQFCTSIILIVGTVVVLKQLEFLQKKRLGYDKENVIILPLDRKTSEVYSQLRVELMKSGKVVEVARANEAPTKIRGGYSLNQEGVDMTGMIVTAMSADSSFIPTMKMELLAGRNFNHGDFIKYSTDTVYSFILNETAVKTLGLQPEQAVGSKVNLNRRRGEIVGIVRDFHFASLHTAISPLVLFNEEHFGVALVRLEPGDVTASIQAIQDICKNLLPHRPFEYEFLDQKYSALYSSEQRVATIGSVFASLAIVIACLGLFGLVAFAAAQKTKEIGIRKVMGASASNIVLLITKDYTKLVTFSILLGLPLSAWIVERWFLSSFVYRVDVGVLPFVVTGIACLVIAFVTASYQAIKAALINPTVTLRNE